MKIHWFLREVQEQITNYFSLTWILKIFCKGQNWAKILVIKFCITYSSLPYFQRIIKQAEIDKMSRELDCLYEKQRRFNEDIYDKSQYGLAEVGYLE